MALPEGRRKARMQRSCGGLKRVPDSGSASQLMCSVMVKLPSSDCFSYSFLGEIRSKAISREFGERRGCWGFEEKVKMKRSPRTQ